MSRYHVNVNTGQVGRCGARKGNCPYGGESGGDNHYDSEVEALKAAQDVLTEKYGRFGSVERKSSTRRKGSIKEKIVPAVDENGFVSTESMKSFYEKKDDWDKEKFPEPTINRMDNGYGPNPWKGSNRDKIPEDAQFNTTKIASAIRSDVKDAISAGYLPEGLKLSINSSRGSASSVNIYIENLGELKDVYDWTPAMDNYGLNNRGRKMKKEYQVVVDRLEAIHKSYNFSDSDIMTDYFNTGYYGGVTNRKPHHYSWSNLEKAGNKRKRLYKKMMDDGMSEKEILKSPEYEKMEKELDDYRAKRFYYDAEISALTEYTRGSKATEEIDWDEIHEISSKSSREEMDKIFEYRKNLESEIRSK